MNKIQTKYKSTSIRKALCLAGLIALSSQAWQVQADTHTDINASFDQAVYTEETLGDLDTAIKLYTDIIANTDNQRVVSAKALLHLGRCYKKLGDNSQALLNFNALIDQYGDFANIVANAEDEKFSLPFTQLNLLPPPWVDGEVLEYTIHNPAGLKESYTNLVKLKQIGTNGQVQWLNQQVFASAHNRRQIAVSLLEDEESGETISTDLRGPHWPGMSTEVKDGKVIMRNNISNEVIVEDFKPGSISDSSMETIIRRLPLQKDYSVTIPSYSHQAGGYIHLDLQVLDDNTRIDVPAGSYNTYHVKVTYRQFKAALFSMELWVAKDEPSRPIVMYSVQHQTFKLKGSGSLSASQATTYRYASKNAEFELAKRWHAFDTSHKNDEHLQLMIVPFDATGTVGYLDVSDHPTGEWYPTDPKMPAEWAIEWATGFFKNFVPREATMEEFTVNGNKAIRYVSDYEFNKKAMVEYRAIILHEKHRYSFIFQIEKDSFESHRAEYDQMIESFKVIDATSTKTATKTASKQPLNKPL